ncbi:MAG: hypothetical protein ABL977_07985, partial [Candidatus Eisenbacteria bacterium]
FPPRPASKAPAVPAAASADTSARVFVSLISGRDETGRDLNLMSINITNYGFIGNNFTVRTPSMEYPVGTGHEHLVRGGLWVGAIAADQNGAFTGVTTGAVDGFTGDASANASEFAPEGDRFEVRSSLPNNRRFSPRAVSERDLISNFDDLNPKRAENNREDHRPLGIVVKQDNYSWSFADYRHMVFFHWVIKNTGAPLRNAYVAVYNELASGPKNNFSNWPPGGAWFRKKQVAWIDSLDMYTERYCQSVPIPNNCFYSITPEIAAVKLLGVRPGNANDPLDKQVTMQTWSFAPGDTARDEDIERYALMSSGQKTVLDPLPPDLSPPAGDPVQLISIGPFAQINPGDSVEVDFVYLGGTDQTNLIKRAQTAQRAYDLNYKVPVPPPSPRFKVVARDGAMDFYWDESPEAFEDPTSPILRDFEGYRVYAGDDRDDLRMLAQFDLSAAPHDTTGFNTGLAAVRLATPVVIDGVSYQYKYTLANLRDGFKYFTAVTAYDLGTTEIESLESGRTQNEAMVVPAPRAGERSGGVVVFPNPYRVEAAWDHGQNVREHYLWFANLPSRCTIRIYTLAGDLVYDYAFDGATYNGSNARGVFNPASDLPGTFSGATFGWDLVTRRGQAAATGLYMWSVEDQTGGKTQVGKVLIVKSDREGLQ